MSAPTFKVGDVVLFTAPDNANMADHGLTPGDVVAASILETDIKGPGWYTIEYDQVIAGDRFMYHREISAHVTELSRVA